MVLKQDLDNLYNEKNKASKEIEDKSKESQIKAMQEKNTIDQLKAIIAEREKKVKTLETELEDVKQQGGTGSEFFLRNAAPKTTDNETPFELESVRNRPPSTPSYFQRNTTDNSSFIERQNSR